MNRCYLSRCEHYNPDDTCMYGDVECQTRDNSIINKAYRQGRLDAIDECINSIMQNNFKVEIKNLYTNEIVCLCKNEMKRILLRLKEKKNKESKQMCEYESSTGKCTLNECMYEPITNKDKYNLCESVKKSLDDTTTDCEDCEARIRADAIKEVEQIIHNIYTGNFYCIDDYCEDNGMDCDDCLYIAIVKDLEQLKEQK